MKSKKKNNNQKVIVFFIVISILFLISLLIVIGIKDSKKNNETSSTETTSMHKIGEPTTTTTTTTTTKSDPQIDLNKLKKSKKDSDKFVEAINVGLTSNLELKYKKTTKETKWTFYTYESEQGVTVDVIYNNKDNSFHALNILNSEYSYITSWIRGNILKVLGWYDECMNDSSCRQISYTNDIKVKLYNFELENSKILDEYQFFIMNLAD